MYKYFSQTDFSKATPTCQIEDMDTDFMNRLDAAREIASIPFIINSAYRTVDYEKSKGRDGSSSHTKGLAADIKCTSSRNRFVIVEALRKAGFNRLGIGDTFIHVDYDTAKDANVIWDYYE